MKAEFKKSHISEVKSEVLCVFLMQDEEPPHILKQFLKDVKKERYEGKPMQTFSTATRGEAKFKHLLVVGLGKKDDFKLDYLRRAAGTAMRYTAELKEKEFAMHLSAKFVPKSEQQAMAQAMTEGALLASYKFTRYKTKKDEIFEVEKAWVVTEEDVSEGIRRGAIMATAQNYARELDELPANISTPATVVAEAKKLARGRGISITVFAEGRPRER